MPDITWMLIAACFVFFAVRRGSCGRRPRRGGLGAGRGSAGGDRSVTHRARGHLAGSQPPADRAPAGNREPVRARETPVQVLQREFVEGRLTLDEYERELDALDRLD